MSDADAAANARGATIAKQGEFPSTTKHDVNASGEKREEKRKNERKRERDPLGMKKTGIVGFVFAI